MKATEQQYMAAEQAPGGQRFLTGNASPGWEITRFVSSAKLFPTKDAAEDAVKPWNNLGFKFEVVPAQVLA